ncbi:MAG: hypothetical protein R2726_07355 [Acidimicrobiales bacterium]
MRLIARSRRAVAAVLLLAAVLTAPALATDPAAAQVGGGCSATVNGTDADSARSARTAVVVDEGESVVVTGNAPGPISGYDLYLTFGPIRFPAASGTVESGKTSYTTTVDVGDYARYGVGLYRVEGETVGTPCTGWAYVKVVGPFPLFTVAGVVGAALTLVGLVGMALSWPRQPAPAIQPRQEVLS